MLVQKFINTRNIEKNTDELVSPQHLVHWLAKHGLMSKNGQATQVDLQRFLKIREGLRSLVMLNNGEENAVTQSLRELNEILGRQAIQLTTTASGEIRARPIGKGLDYAAGSIFLEVYRCSIEGTWKRFKVCQNDKCLWAFYDQSKNHSRKWCTMLVCGNRMKVSRYNAKRREELKVF